MKTHSFYLLAGAAGLLAFAAPISGQNTPARSASVTVAVAEVPPQVLGLIDQLTEQNKQLSANQAVIDAKIDEITESIRQARIFATRSGGKAAN